MREERLYDLEALALLIKEKQISGAAIDVFPVEPEKKR